MGSVAVDQLRSDGSVLRDVDTRLSAHAKNELLLSALPGASVATYAGEQVVRYRDQVILKKQVTHLGYPWPEYKKRIQIPKRWLDVERQAREERLIPRFVGIYHYGDVTIFVDFEPSTYVQRKANNSAAHVATNDLFQAQTLGQFSKDDRNGNRLTTVRADRLEDYLLQGYKEANRHLEALRRFSAELLDGRRIEGLDAVREMHSARWPDRFQNEWAGFYVEYRLDRYVKQHRLEHLVVVQKVKLKGEFDYDLRFVQNGAVQLYGDLKASNIALSDSPGNDAAAFARCLEQFGRFWYVVYEHETWHSRDRADIATIEWNTWRRSVGHVGREQKFNPLSYAGRFKEAVRFVGVKVLEVNMANQHIVLGDFQGGFRQPDGKARKGKVMIRKKDIDDFLIYSERLKDQS
ncbi:hypothetical protein ACOCJ5_07440 [Knoellia sp. CPCC 206450]|uniref:hypothetical protein n=1 Tax=Knoellia tibetensis TaxID=3404798 RepID=UPI003B439446